MSPRPARCHGLKSRSDLAVRSLLSLWQGRASRIKTIQRRPWGDRPHTSSTWYEPFNDQPSIDLAIHWALSRPGVFINTAGDIHVLPKILDAASRYEKAPTSAEMEKLIQAQQAEPLWA